MNIYSLDERYINYLQKFDGRVCISKLNQAFGRKYVGAVFKVNDLEYFAPLSSKVYQKHFTDVRLYDEKIKCYIGSVKLNNMIPLPKNYRTLLKEVSYKRLSLSKNEAERKYGALIERQYIKLNDVSIKFQILSKAQKFYRSYNLNPKLKMLCCDFKLLEQKALEFSLDIFKDLNKEFKLEKKNKKTKELEEELVR